jgi:hypothetical protein
MAWSDAAKAPCPLGDALDRGLHAPTSRAQELSGVALQRRAGEPRCRARCMCQRVFGHRRLHLAASATSTTGPRVMQVRERSARHGVGSFRRNPVTSGDTHNCYRIACPSALEHRPAAPRSRRSTGRTPTPSGGLDPAAMNLCVEERDVGVTKACSHQHAHRWRVDRLRGLTRLHEPTPDEPLIVVVVVDELASLTAYAERDVHGPIWPNPVADRSPRSEGISRTVVHRPGPPRGAGGNRTPVRRAVADRATTIPEIYGSTAAAPPGRWASRGGRRRVCSPMPAVFPAASGLSRRQSPLLLPGCGDQALRALTGRGCSRCAWRSGDEGVLLIGSCVCAPFKESEQLRSHDSASGPDVETDQPRWWYRLSSSFTILPAF